MTKKKIVEENRIVDEMLEMAQSLQEHAVILKQEMTKLLQLIENVC
jgi:hypothetical protein